MPKADSAGSQHQHSKEGELEMRYEAKVFVDNLKLKRVYYDAQSSGDTALEEWALNQLKMRGVLDENKNKAVHKSKRK